MNADKINNDDPAGRNGGPVEGNDDPLERKEGPAVGYVTEIFRSIQGEGIYAGVMQVFIRLGGCSLGCEYCDTPGSSERTGTCLLHAPSGDVVVENPIEAGTAAAYAASVARVAEGVHSLSVTGGEPLEQAAFLREFLQIFRLEGLPVYLETNGAFVEEARLISPLVDIVSMDIKLPSLCGGRDLFGIYEEVLPIFGPRGLFVKVVVAGGLEMEELAEAARLVAGFDSDLPLVIQPVTAGGACVAAEGEELVEAHSVASKYLSDVRVIPQCHTLLGLK